MKVKSNGDDDILATRNINPQELIHYRDLKNQGHQHQHDRNLQCQIRQESCSIVLTKHKGHALPGTTNANNCFAE